MIEIYIGHKIVIEINKFSNLKTKLIQNVRILKNFIYRSMEKIVANIND